MMSTSSGPTKLLHAAWTTANELPATSTAGQTPRRPLQPLIVTTSHAGMRTEMNGSCLPATALSTPGGMPVTAPSVRIGVPIAPNATGAVFAMSERPPACSGGNPRPIKSAAEMATGVPNPHAPSMNAPNENAMRSAWMRRSGDRRATDERIVSNVPVCTVRLYRNSALTMIHPIGKKPYAAPREAAANAEAAGMPNTPVATRSAATRPASAARCAGHWSSARVRSSVQMGSAAAIVLSAAEPSGLYTCTQSIPHSSGGGL